MTKQEIIRQIIEEEVGGLADETFKNDETIQGTLQVRRQQSDELEPPSSVEPIETDADEYADSVLAPENHLPDDVKDIAENIESITEALANRLGVIHRSNLFRATHTAKMRVKQLREGTDIDLSSLRHAVVSEYIDIINEHLQTLTECEKQILAELSGIALYDKNARPKQILESATNTMLAMIEGAAENGDEGLRECKDTFLVPYLSYLSELEGKTRFSF